MSIYEERHVLFCDILGFTQAVIDGKIDPAKLFLAFNHLQAAVNELNKAIDPEATDAESGRAYDYIVTPRAEHFSDCIAISTPATNVDAIWLCEAASELQNLLVRRGFLSRGAICTGLLHHTETSVFGPAFIEAVHREEKTRYPRIEISSELLLSFRKANTLDDKAISNIRERQLVLSDDHGCTWIDPFHYLKLFVAVDPPPHPHVKPAIDAWRRVLTDGLLSEDEKVFEKYAWMSKRFNEGLVRSGSWILPVMVPERSKNCKP
jgi:hypothetical protein